MSGFIRFRRWGAVLFFAFFFTHQVHAEPFRVGFFEVAPHATRNSQGDAKGTAVQYFRLIAVRMGIGEMTFSELPLPRLIEYLRKNEIDAGLVMAKNSERKAMFVYPQSPFFKIRPAISIRKDQPLREVRSVDDLLPLRISCYSKGYLSPMMRDKRLKLIPINFDDVLGQSYKIMEKARVDAAYSPDIHSLRFKRKKGGHESDIRILPLPETPVGMYTVFSKKSAGAFLEKYERALEGISETRPYETMIEEFIRNYK